MKRSKFGGMWAPISLVLLFALTAILAFAQKKPAAAEAKVEAKAAPHENFAGDLRKAGASSPHSITIWAVVQDFHGSFNEVNGEMGKFKAEVQKQKLKFPDRGNVGILVLRDEPHGGVGDMSVGVQTNGQMKVNPPLASRQFSAAQGVTFNHRGEYAQLENSHRELEKIAKANHHELEFPVWMRLHGEKQVELVEKVR
jgi:hypothetical protein